MSSAVASRLARTATGRLTSATQRRTAQSAAAGVRCLASYSGPWPGPNPLKDVFYGLSLGLLAAIGFKGWQIKDKADRVTFYQEYERAVRVDDARKDRERSDKKKADGDGDGDGDANEEEEATDE